MDDWGRESVDETADRSGVGANPNDPVEWYVASLGDRSPGVVVVELVAAAVGRDPTELAPLYETVDPRTVDALFESTAENEVAAAFTYMGYRVRVTAGYVVIVSDGR